MSTDLQTMVRDRIVQVLTDVTPAELDMSADLAGQYGLTSLNKVLLVISACDESGVDVAHFTEQDIAAVRSGDDLVSALSAHQGAVA
ncbi:acyl carrier protein [Actinoplanes sp. NPDC049599]|uniref:acyl carrier protein n=1 Tax=Actinoplanes sp. NPDC049599 TaxID=3363903 RepID=UPI0037BBCFD5